MISFHKFLNNKQKIQEKILYNKDGVIKCSDYAETDYRYLEDLGLKDNMIKNSSVYTEKRINDFNIDKLILTQSYVYAYNVQNLIKEIKTNNYNKPLEVLFYNNKYYLQDGHHRYFALRILQIKKYPIILYKRKLTVY